MKLHFLKFIFAIISILSFRFETLADNPLYPNLFVSPSINLGYCFGSGFTYGIKLDVGLVKISQMTLENYAGISFSYYLVNFQGGVHRIKTLNVEIMNKYFQASIGAGSVTKNWGLRHINSDKAFGTSIDFSVYSYLKQTPWFGFKFFRPSAGTWNWYERPMYKSFYMYLKEPQYRPY